MLHSRFHTALVRKWDKGEAFQMPFEDSKMYKGVILGCADCVVVEDHRSNPTQGSTTTGAVPDLGVPWEALQVGSTGIRCCPCHPTLPFHSLVFRY